jgi:hypothetical protein
MLAAGEDRLRWQSGSSETRRFCCGRKLHGEMDAVELAAGIGRSRGFSAPPVSSTASWLASSSFAFTSCRHGVVVEGDALGLHLATRRSMWRLFHLEVGNAVAQQAAGLGVLLVEMHLVAGARQLLGGGHAGRAGADDGDLLAGLLRGASGFSQPFFQARSTMAHSIVLMVTGVSSMLSVQDASHGAGQTRPVNSGKLLVEWRLREASSQSPRRRDRSSRGSGCSPGSRCDSRECRNSCSAPPDRGSSSSLSGMTNSL